MSMPSTIQSWVSRTPGLESLKLETSPVSTPGDGEGLIRVEAAALNFSDILMIDDAYQVRPPRPFIPGQEIAGTVVAVGPNCRLQPGQRVISKVTWGGFASYALVKDHMAIDVPNGMDMVVAASVPVSYTTAAVAIEEVGKIAKGEKVLVLAAAGGVGLACVEIAVGAGAEVIAAAGGADKCEIAKAHGAHHVVDYTDPEWVAVLKRDFGAFNVIADPVGGDFADAALRLLAWEGRYLIIGFASGRIPAIPANRLLLKRAQALGVYWNHDRDQEMLAKVQPRIVDLLVSGIARPAVGSVFPFAELPQALTALARRKTHGKAVLQLGKES